MTSHEPLRASRRSFLLGAGAAASAVLLSACGEEPPAPAAAQNPAPSAGPWSFDDGSGKKVELPQAPKRIVAYVGSAAPLWDLGIKPVGVFGPQRRADGTKDPQAGNIDIDAVTAVGNSWDDFNMEKFLALKPDLVITGRYGKGADELWALPEEQLAKIRKAAPVVGINEYKAALPDVIENYRTLAASLGADLESAGNKAAADGFRAASDELKAAIAAKPGLKVLVAYADKDNLYIARPEFYGDLLHYRALGLDLVSGGGNEDFWEMLSWEQAGKYQADLILTDSRSHALTHAQMAAFPTWKQLPAVQAGQIGLWPGESRFGHQLSTALIKDLTAQITKARADVVSA